MSKEFSQFPNNAPPQDSDKFLIGRVDGGSVSGFSNFTLTWAQIKTALGIEVIPTFLLQEDGTSFFLLEDGVSKLQLE